MAIPFFNGVPIFGIGCYATAIPNPPRIQWNAYNGVAVREGVFLGPNGYRVEFPEFLQTAPDPPTLGAYENIFLALIYNGTSGTLTDTTARVWRNARLVEFKPTTAIEPGISGGVARSYRAVFEVA